MRKQHVYTLGVVGFLGLVAAANAGFSPVYPTPWIQEVNHTQILEDYYSSGTAWTVFGGRTDGLGTFIDFTNGVLTATRIDDFLDDGVTTMLPNPGLTDDQTWAGSMFTVTAVARYAGFEQSLAYDVDGDSEGAIELFQAEGYGSGAAVTGSAAFSLDPQQTFVWVRNREGMLQTSRVEAPDVVDNMVTYQITGFEDGLMRYVIFWEDEWTESTDDDDFDYNDLAVEIVAVPEPVSAALLALGALFFRRR